MIGKRMETPQSSQVDMKVWTNTGRCFVLVFLNNAFATNQENTSDAQLSSSAPSPISISTTGFVINDKSLLMLTSNTSLSDDSSVLVDGVPEDDDVPLESSIGYPTPCGLQREESARIVGAENAAPGEFPWQVSVQLLAGRLARHVCGGAVISAYWAITAAHCVHGLKPRDLSVVAGDYDLYAHDGGEQRVYVVGVRTPGFAAATFSRDLALLQLHAPLRLDGRRVAPVCLPRAGARPRAAGALLSGWGRLAEHGGLPRKLRRAALPFIDGAACARQLRRAGFALFLSTCQLCAGVPDGGVDACQGDSGGPLSCRHRNGRFYLCGIVSWGVGCGRPGVPGIYTDISCYTDWIISVIYGRDPASM